MAEFRMHHPQHVVSSCRGAKQQQPRVQMSNCHKRSQRVSCSLDSACNDASTKSECPSGVTISPPSTGNQVARLPLVPELPSPSMDVDACMSPQLTLHSGMDYSDPVRFHNCLRLPSSARSLSWIRSLGPQTAHETVPMQEKPHKSRLHHKRKTCQHRTTTNTHQKHQNVPS